MDKYSDSKIQPIHPVMSSDLSDRYYSKIPKSHKVDRGLEPGLFERILQRQIELLNESEDPKSNPVLDEIGKSFDVKYQEYQLKKMGNYSKD